MRYGSFVLYAEGPRGPASASVERAQAREEAVGMTTIDPILLSVYARTFKSITDEMSISMEQTTRSPILCEAKDFVTGLYDAEGRMLEQTENLPILAFSLAPVCKYIRKYFGDDIHPGDVILPQRRVLARQPEQRRRGVQADLLRRRAGRLDRGQGPPGRHRRRGAPAATTRTRSRSGRRRCASRRSRSSSAASCARTSGT